jgi:oligopeptide transport system substrate-binding protein
VTYESLLKRVRRIYHGLVADWLIEQAGERAGEYTALIADHLEQAGRSEEAAGYLVEAGDRARGLYAHREAVGAYQRALALLKQLGDQAGAAGVLMKLGLAHHSAFDFAKSRQAYDEAFALQQVSEKAGVALVGAAPHVLRGAFPPPSTLDPTLADDTQSAVFIDQLFSGLVELTPELDVVPDVARRWEVLDGGRRYVLHLRDDVRWSDGVPVSAADFEFALKRVLDPATSSRNASLLYGIHGASDFHQGRVTDPDQVGVRAVDDLTLEVRLQRPAGYFLYLLSHSATYAVPRHAVRAHGEAWTQPDTIVTNGPFTIGAWHGESVVLARRPEYHGRRTGNLRRVELALLPSADWARGLAMYEADELDVLPLHDAPVASRERVREAFPDEHVLMPGGDVFYVVFDVTRAPFDDPRVRLAFTYALDRHALTRDVLGDTAVAATGGFVPQGMPGHTPGIGLQHDPRRARQLLAEAGYPGGEGFPRQELLTWPRCDEETRHLLTQWREALGVDLSIKRVIEWADYLRVAHEHAPSLFLMCWVADYPDPDTFMRVPIRDQTGWHHPAYDDLVDRALQVTDQTERMRLYSQADRILVHEAPVLPVSYSQTALLIKPWVREYPVHAFSHWLWKHVIIEPH